MLAYIIFVKSILHKCMTLWQNGLLNQRTGRNILSDARQRLNEDAAPIFSFNLCYNKLVCQVQEIVINSYTQERKHLKENGCYARLTDNLAEHYFSCYNEG